MHQNITTTLIVDDELHAAELLQHLLQSFSIFGHTSIVTDPAAAFEAVMTNKPDFLFLDVEMPEIDGLDLHEKLLPHAPHTKVIYVTGHEKYALEALRKNPFDYLVKPVSRSELLRITGKLMQNGLTPDQYSSGNGEPCSLTNSNGESGNNGNPGNNKHAGSNHLLIHSLDGIHHIPLDDIVFLEADCSYTKLVMNKGKKILASCNLGKIIPSLPEDMFFRISRKHMVNRNYVTFYHSKDKYLELETTGQTIRLDVMLKVQDVKRILTNWCNTPSG